MQISSSLSSTSSVFNMDEMDTKLSASIVSAKDTDSSGDLTASELGVTDSQVAEFDTDGNGTLSGEELAAALKAKREKMQAQMSTQMSQSSQLGMLQSSLGQGSSATQGTDSSKPSLDDMVQGLFSDSSSASASATGVSGASSAQTASNAGDLLSQFMSELDEMDKKLSKDILASKDKNGDGSLSADELGVTSEQLSKLDTNGDGTLGESELTAGLKTQRETMMAENGGAMPPPPPPESSSSSSSTGSTASTSSTGATGSTGNLDTLMASLFASSSGTDSTGLGSGTLAEYMLRQKASNAYQSMDSLIAGLFEGGDSTSQSVSVSA